MHLHLLIKLKDSAGHLVLGPYTTKPGRAKSYNVGRQYLSSFNDELPGGDMTGFMWADGSYRNEVGRQEAFDSHPAAGFLYTMKSLRKGNY